MCNDPKDKDDGKVCDKEKKYTAHGNLPVSFPVGGQFVC